MPFPNLRRIFVKFRTEAGESAYSRRAFYNLIIFVTSVAFAAITAQKLNIQYQQLHGSSSNAIRNTVGSVVSVSKAVAAGR